jgi:hypothetical protein
MIQPDRQYTKVIEKLGEQIKGEVLAVLAGDIGEDKAQNFGAISLSPEDSRATFDRSGIEEEYTQSLAANELSRGIQNRLQCQNTVLGALEKTFRMRHRRRIDNILQSAARSQGLTSDTGYVTHVLGRLPFVEAL